MPRKQPSSSALTVFADRLRSLYRALLRVRMPRIFGLVRRNPRDSLCAVALMLGVTAIIVNGLYLQPGRHPAPMFAVRPQPGRPAAAEAGSEAAPRSADIRTDAKGDTRADRAEARRQAKADPKADPKADAKTDPPPRNDPPRPHASPPPPARTDPATEAANPSWQVSLLQRTLNDAGFGPIRVTGVLDDPTREGIARFERAHNLPVTGQNTPRVRHAVGAAIGRALE